MTGKIVIATPVFGGACGRYVASLVKTQRELSRRGVEHDVLILDGDAYVAQARNTLALSFLAGDGDMLFFIDQDMAWEPEGFMRVATAGKPIVAASYPMKNQWKEWTARLVDADGGLTGTPRADGAGHLIEAEMVPMGFTAITRDALMVMRDKRREYDYPHPMGGGKFFHHWFATPPGPAGLVGEDVWFCREWRRIGGQLWVEPDVTLQHIGAKAWEGNLHDTLRAPPAEPPVFSFGGVEYTFGSVGEV